MNKFERNKVAKLNPFKSVVDVCLDYDDSQKLYFGVKNVKQIPYSLIEKLERTNKYKLHTIDTSSLGGRAIDLNLINPITGNYMTGSSSGTAINVFCNINDFGIGTDGGGSVIAPSLSLNLFGFISNLIEEQHMLLYKRESTDGIPFTPSVGFITKQYDILLGLIDIVLGIKPIDDEAKVFINESDDFSYPFKVSKIKYTDIYGSRDENIKFLRDTLVDCDFLISYEGPVDVLNYGDTILGHFNETTKMQQRNGKKGLLRVANMVNATCICVPDTDLACGWVLICESKSDKIAKLLAYAKKLVCPRDQLIENYFGNSSMYFNKFERR